MVQELITSMNVLMKRNEPKKDQNIKILEL